MQKKIPWKVLACILACVLLVFGGPIIINSAYKYGLSHTPLFNTLWGADDALSYYGSVLGAAITALSLFLTIRFTRNQIQRESYQNRETDKWAKIEDTIGSILNEINPMPILMQEADNGTFDSIKAGFLLQKYQISCRIATDPLMSRVNTVDFERIKALVGQITEVSAQLVQITQKKIDQYSKQRQLEERKVALELLTNAGKFPDLVAAGEIARCERIIADTNEIRFEDIEEEILQINKELVSFYDTRFRPLLQLKGITFESINSQIQANADKMLSLRRE